jgi:hypothetical protein
MMKPIAGAAWRQKLAATGQAPPARFHSSGRAAKGRNSRCARENRCLRGTRRPNVISAN